MPKMFKPGGKGKYIFFYTDLTGQRRKKTLEADRAISERLKAAFLEKVRLRKDGLVDERDEKFSKHDGKPLKDHLADYARVLSANGVTDKHAETVAMHVARVLELAKLRRISDLSASRVQEALAHIRRTRSAGTVNEYTTHVKGFSRWLWRDRRARDYVLADIKKKDARNDRCHVRRRMTDAEVLAVITAAENGREMMSGFTGPDRAMLYRIAHGTGFRAKELRTLTPERFRLDDNPPTITALGCYTKNRREAVQPIKASLADLLRPWLARRPRGKPVFDKMNTRTAEMLREDLEAAGVPYKTDEGVADFHASRGTYVSNLVASGASVKTCQTLARHSEPALTIGIYAKSSWHDVQGAVEKLPDLLSTTAEPEAMRATGTDGGPQSATSDATSDANGGNSDDPNVLSINTLSTKSGDPIIVSLKR
jgi:integrase